MWSRPTHLWFALVVGGNKSFISSIKYINSVLLETHKGMFSEDTSPLWNGLWKMVYYGPGVSFTPYFPLIKSGDGYWESWLHSTAANSSDLLRACECLLHAQNRGQKEVWINRGKTVSPQCPITLPYFRSSFLVHASLYLSTHPPTLTLATPPPLCSYSSSSPAKALIWCLCWACFELDGALFSKKSRTLDHGMVERTWGLTLNLDIFLFI